MEKLCCGLPTRLVQNQWYALPTHKCTLYTSATAPTLVQSSDANQATTTSLTLAAGFADVNGTYLRVTTAVGVDDRILLNRA